MFNVPAVLLVSGAGVDYGVTVALAILRAGDPRRLLVTGGEFARSQIKSVG